MKQFLATGVIVLLTLGGALAQEAAKTGGGKAAGTVAQSLIDMENQWAKASKAGNADALAPMLSEDFVALDSDGSVRRRPPVPLRDTAPLTPATVACAVSVGDDVMSTA